KRARQDMAEYGFVVDRKKALAEQFPSYAVVKRESPLHPAQRERARAWAEAMGTPEARARTAAAERVKAATAWQEAEADRMIAEQKAKYDWWPIVDEPPVPDAEPEDMGDLIHEAITDLRARYGGPLTFEEDK